MTYLSAFQSTHQALTLAQEEGGDSGFSVLEMIVAGGSVAYVIVLLSFVAVALMVMHMLQLRRTRLAPDEDVKELERLLSEANLEGAVAYCQDEDHQSFLANVVGAGLSRAQRSPFGMLELKGALEEAGQEQASRMYRSTDGLGLITGIAPMLGLLGTVVGMVGAFNTISTTQGFARPDQLAGDISQALVTTLMGLTLAIPSMAAFTYFRNRIDALVSEIALTIADLAALIEHADATGSTPSSASAGAPAARAPTPRVQQGGATAIAGPPPSSPAKGA